MIPSVSFHGLIAWQQEQSTSDRGFAFLITTSRASGAGTATIRESEATPTALSGSFRISLSPGLADGALFSRRHGASLERADDEQRIQEDEEHTLQ